MPRFDRIDDNASTTSSTAGLTRAERLANRQRVAVAAQALINVKNPTVVSSPLSAGGSPPVRSRGRSLHLSNLNEEDDESKDDAHANDEDNDDQSDDDSDDNDQSDDDDDKNVEDADADEDDNVDHDNANDDAHGENEYLAYRARKIARNESKLRALGLAVPSHATSNTAVEDLVDDTNDSVDNDRNNEDYTDHPDDDDGDDEDDGPLSTAGMIWEAQKRSAETLPFRAGEWQGDGPSRDDDNNNGNDGGGKLPPSGSMRVKPGSGLYYSDDDAKMDEVFDDQYRDKYFSNIPSEDYRARGRNRVKGGPDLPPNASNKEKAIRKAFTDKTRRLNYAKMKAANTKASPLKITNIDCDTYSGDQCAHIRLMEIVEKCPLKIMGHTYEQKETLMIRVAEDRGSIRKNVIFFK